ncbi:hypothetical protein Tco_0535774 [Tanacetum coccineum]
MASSSGIELQEIPPQTITATTTTTTTAQPACPQAITTTATATTTTATATATEPPNRRRWRLHNVIIIAVASIFLLCVGALLIIHLVVDVGGMKASVLDVQDLNVKHTILTNTSVVFEANATLGVKFKTTGNVKPTPVLAVFNLTMVAFNRSIISTFANASYSISEKIEQVLVVHFEPHVNHLPEEEVWVLDRWLTREEPYMLLTVDFRWKLKNEEILVIPPSPRHAYFRCAVPYAPTRGVAREFYPRRCKRVTE